MALSTGTKLGPYEIQSPLGAGGMGEVYRANDSKLKREVALKVLPEAVAKDAERMTRFHREAQVLASLNHPGIASIYGFEESAGVRALVMELVEGPTLADRIAQGPLPLDEALPVAKQIAEALEFAHEKGVIHRDLKPANIKVRPDGTVKVLDFGLAKALADDPASRDSANSPTLSAAATKAGVLLGTAAYMSPEQARGKAADRRADIWSFGAVLYEMLSGKRAFHGETVSDTLAAVIRAEPEWAKLPASTPRSIRNLLRRCLDKDPKLRLQAIGEARIALEAPLTAQPADDGTPVAAGQKAANRFVIVGAAGLLALCLGLVIGYFARSEAQRHTIRSLILPPEKFGFAESGISAGSLAVSADGTHVVYAVIGEGKQFLYVRSLTALTGQPLAGTEGATYPFWSPDGRAIGFFAEGRLKRIDATGGPVTVLCSASEGRGGTWNRDGVIVFAPTVAGGLSRISATGGAPVALTKLDPSRHQNSHRWPQFLPDGRHFLYLARDATLSDSGIYVGAIDSPDRVRVVDSVANASYTPPGYLLYPRGSSLVAQAFDAKSLRTSGDPVPVADQFALNGIVQRAVFSVSENGILVYSPPANFGISQFIWVDRSGKQIGSLGSSGGFGAPKLSPDGRKLAVSITDPGNTARSDLWIFDLARGLKTRLTFNPSDTSTYNIRPIWSPDGEQIVFTSNRSGHYQSYQRAANGLGTDRLLWPTEDQQYVSSWSSDGKYILLERESVGATVTGQFWVLPTFGDHKPFPLLQGAPGISLFSYPRISPNGRWVVYESAESGRGEVYVSSFPGGGGKWQVSVDGGLQPIWRADGKEIFFLSQEEKMMAARISEQKDNVVVGNVQSLFQTHVVGSADLGYDAAPDGKKFLLNSLSASAGSEPLTLVVNWDAELKKK